jgi:penicillin amidase
LTARAPRRRLLVGAALLLGAVMVLAAGAALWMRGRMIASLPMLDGESQLHGLAAAVRVSRDALGVPTVEGSSRIDVARATGWLHAQDRFFQMDLLRRKAAGELSELFGPAALALDREARMHGFRRLAREVLARESPDRRALFQAYCEGVNAGVAALRSKPWEYSILRMEPRPWTAEDSLLINYAMTLDLQESTGRYVRSLSAIRDELGPAAFAFLAPLATPSDAALDGSVEPPAKVPPASELDLRAHAPAQGDGLAGGRAPRDLPWNEGQSPGSNSFAVAGALASGGAALVANDMHLHLGVPNIWYRISLKWPGHEETGVSLPGLPALIAGSTGRIAWGFTNSNAGTGDILVVNPSISPEFYHGPAGAGLMTYERRSETVAVKGSKPVSMVFPWTQWGPVVADAPGGQELVFHWTEDDPAATNLAILDLEDAPDVASAVAIAHRMGIPAMNFVVADSAGRIAWTVAGMLPKRIGYDGRLAVSWIFGDRRWDGYLDSREVPEVVSPSSGIIWTANNRTMGGGALASLGDAGYDIGARARQIRDDLGALVHSGRPVEARDLLAIQLDDRALFLETWHSILMRTLSPPAVAARASRAALLQAAQNWTARADVDSVGYRVVRAFRLAVAHRALDPIFAPCVERDPGFTWNRINYEQPLETLVNERPAHLLDPAYANWDALLQAAADDVSLSYEKAGLDPRKATWGERNTARIAHPFAQLLPWWAGSHISMPADPLPGDSNMPRVQDTSFGASERFVVSPGREADGIFQMPGGQNSNPYSPFFRAGHEAWVRGDPTPFLPGPPEHTLHLLP